MRHQEQWQFPRPLVRIRKASGEECLLLPVQCLVCWQRWLHVVSGDSRAMHFSIKSLAGGSEFLPIVRPTLFVENRMHILGTGATWVCCRISDGFRIFRSGRVVFLPRCCMPRVAQGHAGFSVATRWSRVLNVNTTYILLTWRMHRVSCS